MHLQPTVHHFWFNHLLVEKSTKLFLIKNSEGEDCLSQEFHSPERGGSTQGPIPQNLFCINPSKKRWLQWHSSKNVGKPYHADASAAVK